MGKILKFIADLAEAMMEASATFNAIERSVPVTTYRATYGDVVVAVTRHVKDGFWKKQILRCVPKNADPSEYAAVIAICEDKTMDDFWKKQAIEEVFEDP